MNKKLTFSSELAYFLGLFLVAFSAAMLAAANFGVSMIVAPAYLIYLKVSQYLTFFTFGMAEYCFQGLLIIVIAIIMRRFRLSYLFCFVTAVLYGVMLDGSIAIVNNIPTDTMVPRIILYIGGIIVCGAGVALIFHTYITPEAYEFFVKEISGKFGFNLYKFKTIYDCSSAVVGVLFTIIFFGISYFVNGEVRGVYFGTIFCALINGYVISLFSKLFEKIFEFKDSLKLRKYFE